MRGLVELSGQCANPEMNVMIVDGRDAIMRAGRARIAIGILQPYSRGPEPYGPADRSDQNSDPRIRSMRDGARRHTGHRTHGPRATAHARLHAPDGATAHAAHPHGHAVMPCHAAHADAEDSCGGDRRVGIPAAVPAVRRQQGQRHKQRQPCRAVAERWGYIHIDLPAPGNRCLSPCPSRSPVRRR